MAASIAKIWSGARPCASMTPPAGGICPGSTSSTVMVPGFLYRPYKRSMGRATLPIAVPSTAAVASGKSSPTRTFDWAERLDPSGPSEWRVRFAPTEVGAYRLEFVLRTRTGLARLPAKLVSLPAKGGFVRVSSRDHRFFALDDGLVAVRPRKITFPLSGPQGHVVVPAGHSCLPSSPRRIPPTSKPSL